MEIYLSFRNEQCLSFKLETKFFFVLFHDTPDSNIVPYDISRTGSFHFRSAACRMRFPALTIFVDLTEQLISILI